MIKRKFVTLDFYDYNPEVQRELISEHPKNERKKMEIDHQRLKLERWREKEEREKVKLDHEL